MDLNMALIKADILMAKQGISLYEDYEIKEVKNTTAYHIQQAVDNSNSKKAVALTWKDARFCFD